MSVLLEENKRRNLLLDSYYNPITGEGSTLERQLVEIAEFEDKLYLPASMLNVEWINLLASRGNIKDFVRKDASNYEMFWLETDPKESIIEHFISERINHDFEYWAAIGVKILHKDTFSEVPFILRGAQRKLLFALEAMRLANVPIRIVLLKARQWGGSTLVQFYMMWIQQRHRRNWHMAVCAQDDNAAKNIRGMYTRAAKSYPEELGTITLKRYENSTKNQICIETGGVIGVGSVNNPDQFRSYNFAMSHLSEVGVWRDTPQRSSFNLITSLKETVPDQPYTIVVEESTAKGLNYFYDSWLKAIKGETRYNGVFVAWWEIDRCRIEVKDIEKFYQSMTSYENFQWQLGATIEGIAWYRAHKADKGYSDWMMMQENPSTPEEAFQSTGQKVFAPSYIEALRQDNNPPVFQGEVFADARLGKECLNNIRFENVQNGFLKIWKMPEVNSSYSNRYVVSVDIGGRTERADNSVIRVFDRAEMITIGSVESVLTWKGHTDQDLLAWKAVQIAHKYDNALLIVEGNSLEKEEEGSHFQTVLDQIKDHYRNLYIRNDPERVGSEFIPRYGWWTTAKNKTTAINALNAASRERMLVDSNADEGYYLIENDKEVCDEMSWFETKQDGKQGAVQGKHDDLVMTTAIGVHVAINEMPLPELKRKEFVRTSVKKRSHSSF